MKILYNVTINIDEHIADEWATWMKNHHIPDVMQTGCFESYMMNQIISGEHTGGLTFAIQYLAPDIETYQKYADHFAPSLQAAHQEKYNGKFGAFRTLMEVIDQGNN